jgi:hypothetical protein
MNAIALSFSFLFSFKMFQMQKYAKLLWRYDDELIDQNIGISK